MTTPGPWRRRLAVADLAEREHWLVLGARSEEIEGVKTWRQAVAHRDGKKVLEADLQEITFPANLEESVFGAP